MPTGKTNTPWTIPLLEVHWVVFPEGEVLRVSFFLVDFDACARVKIVERVAGQFTVAVEFCDVVIDVIVDDVCVAFFDEGFLPP